MTAGCSPSWRKTASKVSTLTNAGMARPTYGLYNLPRYGIRMDRTVPMVLRQRATAAPTTVTVSLNGKRPRFRLTASVMKLCSRARRGAAAERLRMGLRSWLERGKAAGHAFSARAVHPHRHGKQVLSPQKRTVQSVTEPTIVDGQSHMIAAFCIDDYNYYRLRSLARCAVLT